MIDKIKRRIGLFIILALVSGQVQTKNIYATENTISPTDAPEQEIISVIMPTVNENEESPFDFILDPQGLIFATGAILYGGGTVEAGANLLFHNKEGEYDFSCCSDRLTVTNCSTMPVTITVTARISNMGDVMLMSDRNFSDNRKCSIYLALIDDAGNEQPLSEKKEVSMKLDMDSDSYSFGLTGECNVNAPWEEVAVHPEVTITWCVEPVYSNNTPEDKKRDVISNKDMEKEREEDGSERDDIGDITDTGDTVDTGESESINKEESTDKRDDQDKTSNMADDEDSDNVVKKDESEVIEDSRYSIGDTKER